MRRKPQSQNNGGYSNHRRGRHGGGGGGGGHGQGNRSRKNYPALREKYLNQARDAMASGDRVMAEYYYQHADHCFRMMMEEGYRPPQPQQQQEGQRGPQAQPAGDDEENPSNSSSLPAFITANYEGAGAPAVDPATIQNWEERDA